MALNLMYVTNDVEVALIAEKSGVDRIMVDLETLGKEERQKNMNTVKSHHSVKDAAEISDVLTKAELLVRINPWNETSKQEIEAVIAAGAKRIMLPMWKTMEEVEGFLKAVDGRVDTTLLLETKEAERIIDRVLTHPLLDEIHIGLNDLHLSHGLTFMFELLANGTVERLCEKCRARGIRYGFGGVARIGEGTLPAERIVMEHYRLGSTRVILSRSFCNTSEVTDHRLIEKIFMENVASLRAFEAGLPGRREEDFAQNYDIVKNCVAQIVNTIKESRK